MERVQLETVPFYEHTLAVAVDTARDKWAAVKAICAALGVGYQAQYDKLTDDPQFNCKVILIVGADGKQREMFGVQLNQVHSWLSTINSKRIKASTEEETTRRRSNFLRFQGECQGVLDRHFTGTANGDNGEGSHAVLRRLLGEELAPINAAIESIMLRMEDYDEQLDTYVGKDARLEVSEAIRQFSRETGTDGRVVWGMIRRDLDLSSYRKDIKHVIISYLRRVQLGIHSVK